MAVENSLPIALWAIPVPEFGGVARHVVDVARTGLPGYELVVLVQDGVLAEKLEELGTRVIKSNFGVSAGFLESAKKLVATIAEVQPAVVHSHLAYADVVACVVLNFLRLRKLVQKNFRVPLLVTTEHGIAGNDSVYHSKAIKARGRSLLHRLRLIFTDRAIAVSHSTAKEMKNKWGAREVEVIYNGIDSEKIRSARAEFYTTGNEPPRILSLARLAPEKGLDILIEAFAEVVKVHPQARLELAGEGDLQEELEIQVDQLGIKNSVVFSGFVNPSEALGRSNILVQLSAWENMSYTLLDAKTAGLHVLATDVGGNPEILRPQELLPSLAQTSREKLIQAVVEALKTPRETKEKEPFIWANTQHMTEQIARVYTGEKNV